MFPEGADWQVDLYTNGDFTGDVLTIIQSVSSPDRNACVNINDPDTSNGERMGVRSLKFSTTPYEGLIP